MQRNRPTDHDARLTVFAPSKRSGFLPLLILGLAAGLSLGFESTSIASDAPKKAAINAEGSPTPKPSPPKAQEVQIVSSVDQSAQPAKFYATTNSKAAPLIVALHSWSGDFRQKTPFEEMAIAADWNYVHPNFRGPNRSFDACMSDKALADIDDAIDYALKHGNVDRQNILVVGGSGGGLATLGFFLRSKHDLQACQAWVPISDIEDWYHESRRRGSKYADDVIASTSLPGTEPAGTLNAAECKKRSPIHWDFPAEAPSEIRIYAGLLDGRTGSVPISHSIRFWNRLVEHYGSPEDAVSPEELVDLLSLNVPAQTDTEMLEDRQVVFSKTAKFGSLKIFDGGHETLHNASFQQLRDSLSTEAK